MLEKKFEKWATVTWKDPKTGNKHWIITKDQLQLGHYYLGKCRNARVARWDGTRFWYWRTKFDKTFLEPINHPEDDNGFDLFIPEFWLCDEKGKLNIPIDGDNTR